MAPIELLSLAETMQKTGLAQSTLYNYRASGKFPEPVKLGQRSIAWRSDVVDAWLRANRAPLRISRDP